VAHCSGRFDDREVILVIRKCLATVAVVAAIVFIPAQAWADNSPNPEPSPGGTHAVH
jgi:hypothetical protein